MPHKQRHPHHGLHPIKLNLSHAQIRKAHAGHPIQVTHADIGVGHEIHVHPETHKKLVAAHRARKGSRIHLTHHELAGSGFLDFIKTIASPVLSGLQGVAKEIFPSHAGTIDSIRNGIRTATGYGLKPRKQMHHGHAMNSHGFSNGSGMHGPQHFPGEKSDHYGFGEGTKKRRGTKKHHLMGHGEGINPSGFY